MVHGIDTDFLVAVEIKDHPFHPMADGLLNRILAEDGCLALAPQILAEFTHVVTDHRRMPQPLNVSEAVNRADFWWNAEEVVRVFPNDQAASQFMKWIKQYRLGRKRLLDTLLAATYEANGIRKLITNNSADYTVFGCFELQEFH